MADDIDQSLLSRLQALRASSATPERPPAQRISIDTIERAKTPTREEALAARLKRLREQAAPSPSSSSAHAQPSQTPTPAAQPSASASQTGESSFVQTSQSQIAEAPSRSSPSELDDDEADALFRTDDRTLEQLVLGDADHDLEEDSAEASSKSASREPRDDEVRALLEDLARSVPKDDDSHDAAHDDAREGDGDSDDSDGERMGKEVDSVIARFKDEVEVDAVLGTDQDQGTDPSRQGTNNHAEDDDPGDDSTAQEADVALPSLPSNLTPLPQTSPSSTRHDDITTRLAALRASSSPAPHRHANPNVNSNHEDNDDNDNDSNINSIPSLPSVPTNQPTQARRNLLTPRYPRATAAADDDDDDDDDIDSWCTICLADATLRCLGCDDDPYCARCWREMHRGPAAGYEESTHRAVQFTRSRDGQRNPRPKRAVGAS